MAGNGHDLSLIHIVRAVGALSVLDGIGEIEEAVGSALPGHCSPVAYLPVSYTHLDVYKRQEFTIPTMV